MNILFFRRDPVIPHVGGVHRVIDVLTKQFLKRGHSVIFLCSSQQEEIYNFKYFSAPQYYIDLNNISNIKSEIETIIKINSIDFVIGQGYSKDVVTLFENIDSNVKKIFCYHNDPFYFFGKEREMAKTMRANSIFLFFQKNIQLIFPFIFRLIKLRTQRKRFNSILELSDKFCVLSEQFIPEFISKMNLSPEQSKKICAINNPNTFNANFSDIHKENIILYISRLVPVQKRPLDFVKVWELLYKKNSSWKAIVVGDGSELAIMMKYVENHKINNICFKGRQSNIEQFIKHAKMVCLTSNYEGWGMVLVESMAYGCVPLSYNTYAAVSDIIDNNICGYITDPFSPEDMAEKIQYLINDSDMIENFSKAAKHKIKNFTSEKIADQWDMLFESLIHK